jgi:hypothetical protein
MIKHCRLTRLLRSLLFDRATKITLRRAAVHRMMSSKEGSVAYPRKLTCHRAPSGRRRRRQAFTKCDMVDMRATAFFRRQVRRIGKKNNEYLP